MKVNLMNELLAKALELMTAGIGFVFVFLMALIFAITIVSRLINRYFPEPAVPTAPASKAPVAPGAPQVDAQLLSVISAAVKEYRSHHKK